MIASTSEVTGATQVQPQADPLVQPHMHLPVHLYNDH